MFQSWPIQWSYPFIAIFAIWALLVGKLTIGPHRNIVGLGLVWFIWQVLAGLMTADPGLTKPVLIHFAACLLFFYVGWTSLGLAGSLNLFWFCLLAGLLLVLWSGLEQHYGGLDLVRQMVYSQPGWENLPKEYLKKIQSNRIFATLIYPNALAGAILLLLPPLVVAAYRSTRSWNHTVRLVFLGMISYVGLACFYWTGSKAGWLIALAMAALVLLSRPIAKTTKLAILTILICAGLGAFAWKFSAYFQKGAPSVSARGEYWKAAGKTFVSHPLFGTGPGTFSVAYAKIKPPDAEMARLTHNDYLEQASDSGFVGCVTYFAWIWGSLWILYRKRPHQSPQLFAVWLGLVAWAVQQFVEFPLYIPALAWPAFALLGWSLAQKSLNSTTPSPGSTLRASGENSFSKRA